MGIIKLIVCDLDGTLLSADYELTDRVEAAIGSYVERGGLFTLATGRPELTTRTLVNRLGIEVPYILCNGAVIAQGTGLLARHTLALEELAPMLVEADMLGLTVLLFFDEEICALRATSELSAFEQKERIRCRILNLADEAWQSGRVLKLILIGDLLLSTTLRDTYVSRFEHSYAWLQSENNYLEIIPGGHDKGTAMKEVMRLLQVERHEVMAIGNQLNDLEMLQNAGIGVAVANSHPLLRGQADYLCSASYGDGVVEAMRMFCASPGTASDGMGVSRQYL